MHNNEVLNEFALTFDHHFLIEFDRVILCGHMKINIVVICLYSFGGCHES